MTPIHLMFLFGALPAVAYADVQGYSWYSGKKRLLEGAILSRLHIWIYICLAGIISTGTLMALSRPSRYLSSPFFFMKMFFVTTLLVNSVVIGSHMKKAFAQSYNSLPEGEKRLILASGVISGIAWAGAILGGLVIG